MGLAALEDVYVLLVGRVPKVVVGAVAPVLVGTVVGGVPVLVYVELTPVPEKEVVGAVPVEGFDVCGVVV